MFEVFPHINGGRGGGSARCTVVNGNSCVYHTKGKITAVVNQMTIANAVR